MTIEEAFGVVIRRLRRERGLSQEKLSATSNLDRTFISNIEGGKQQPSLISIFALANALCVSVSNILLEVEVILEINHPQSPCPAKAEILRVFNDMATYLTDIQEAYRGTETILFADDEEALRELLAQFLVGCGYNVLMASNGEEAVELYKQHAGKIHVTILDMLMPALNGMEAYNQIKLMSPDAPVLLVSGYYADTRGASSLPKIIQKPFSPVDLLKEIRTVLDS
ncbi:response regulator [Geomonas sp. Red32]|uniref:response regulator n=1 Tax=Geomonas sp. Red32 TaxID=2912856 RepID=UPI00202CCF4D|nr:response regulator [Geomonas sp. Red32]MCM0083905.1 response regulator [Geomonas sp. Red32]